MLGWQFTLMELVEDYQPFAGIAVAVIGAALVLFAMRREPATPVAQAQAGMPATADAGGGDDREGRP